MRERVRWRVGDCLPVSYVACVSAASALRERAFTPNFLRSAVLSVLRHIRGAWRSTWLTYSNVISSSGNAYGRLARGQCIGSAACPSK